MRSAIASTCSLSNVVETCNIEIFQTQQFCRASMSDASGNLRSRNDCNLDERLSSMPDSVELESSFGNFVHQP